MQSIRDGHVHAALVYEKIAYDWRLGTVESTTKNKGKIQEYEHVHVYGQINSQRIAINTVTWNRRILTNGPISIASSLSLCVSSSQ